VKRPGLTARGRKSYVAAPVVPTTGSPVNESPQRR